MQDAKQRELEQHRRTASTASSVSVELRLELREAPIKKQAPPPPDQNDNPLAEESNVGGATVVEHNKGMAPPPPGEVLKLVIQEIVAGDDSETQRLEVEGEDQDQENVEGQVQSVSKIKQASDDVVESDIPVKSSDGDDGAEKSQTKVDSLEEVKEQSQTELEDDSKIHQKHEYENVELPAHITDENVRELSSDEIQEENTIKAEDDESDSFEQQVEDILEKAEADRTRCSTDDDSDLEDHTAGGELQNVVSEQEVVEKYQTKVVLGQDMTEKSETEVVSVQEATEKSQTEVVSGQEVTENPQDLDEQKSIENESVEENTEEIVEHVKESHQNNQEESEIVVEVEPRSEKVKSKVQFQLPEDSGDITPNATLDSKEQITPSTQPILCPEGLSVVDKHKVVVKDSQGHSEPEQVSFLDHILKIDSLL